ncbi:MAG: RHS repeat-associated core domain-containing protein [Anaerolineae bacterium]
MTDIIGVHTYVYDAANRLTRIQLPDSSIQGYTWDNRGNLLADGTFTYTYSAAGRMVRAESLTATLVYTYNADGLRVAQAQSVQSVQSVDIFTWDWATPVPELLGDGDSLYLIGYDTLGWQTGDNWTFVLPDALGSVRQETDAAGAVIAVREWSPYGEEFGTSQAGLGYTGEWFDAYINLAYLRARWYDSQTGRFCQLDQWSGTMWDPQTRNGYTYVEANPISRIDPSGKKSCAVHCGPDITRWFMEEVENHIHYGNQVRGQRVALLDEAYSAVQSAKSTVVPILFWPTFGDLHTYTPFYEIIRGFGLEGIPLPPGDRLIEGAVESLGVLEYALYGLAVDYAQINYDGLLGTQNDCTSTNCPTSEDARIVTLCDRCVDASDLGNIMFGVGASARGYGLALPVGGGYLFNISDEGLKKALTGPDARGTAVGWLVTEMEAYRSKWTFCAVLEGLNFLGYNDLAEEIGWCKACPHKASGNWHSEPSSLERVSGRGSTIDWFYGWLEGFFR